MDKQREHQANERTFLAWLRTSIALISFGFAISRFGLFLQQLEWSLTGSPSLRHFLFNSENLGLVLVAVGLILIPVAAWRFNQVQTQIESGLYRPSGVLVWVTAVLVTLMGILTIPVVLLRERGFAEQQNQPQLRDPRSD